MKVYRFEIVRRAFGRFGWVFVRINDGGRRVLARSERSYRSRKRVRRAIATLKGADDIDDATEDYLPSPLPATSFEFVPGVLPLIVDESPVEEHDAVYKVSVEKAEKDDDREAAAAAQKEEAVSAAAAKPAATKTRAARLRPARRKAP
jgi:uncharacterized protein YegP (UPF0339 family)